MTSAWNYPFRNKFKFDFLVAIVVFSVPRLVLWTRRFSVPFGHTIQFFDIDS